MKIPQDKIELLESIPSWTWDTYESDFQEGFAQLKQYVAEHGHARMPQGYKTDDGFNLGPWVSSRRNNKKKGKLPQDKIELLESLPGWTWDAFEVDFQKGYALLKHYVEKHGHAVVPMGYKTNDGYNLGSWVGSRRGDHKKGKLSQDKIELLESIPISDHHEILMVIRREIFYEPT